MNSENPKPKPPAPQEVLIPDMPMLIPEMKRELLATLEALSFYQLKVLIWMVSEEDYLWPMTTLRDALEPYCREAAARLIAEENALAIKGLIREAEENGYRTEYWTPTERGLLAAALCLCELNQLVQEALENCQS